MGVKLEYHLEGAKELREHLKRIARNIGDPKPFFKAAGLVIMESVNRNFIAGGRPKWNPLKEATLLRRARARMGTTFTATEKRVRSKIWIKSGANKGRITKAATKYMAGAKPLRDTGLLMNSIGSGSYGVMQSAKDHLLIGTNRPGAAVNQETRPFMMLQPADEETLLKLAGDMAMRGTG